MKYNCFFISSFLDSTHRYSYIRNIVISLSLSARVIDLCPLHDINTCFLYLDIIVKSIDYNLKICGITGDRPALKKILNFVGHGGYDCCWFCYLHRQHKDGKRQYPYKRSIKLRSTQMYLHESNEAHRTQSRVNGHLGKGVIENLLDVSLPDSIIIDYLHVTLLGHVKVISMAIYHELTPLQHLSLNNQLKRQRFPHFFDRSIRPFNEF